MKTHCPDCDEPLSIRRGIVPLTATAYCPHCNWCEAHDEDRGKDEKEDWANRNAQNRSIYLHEIFGIPQNI